MFEVNIAPTDNELPNGKRFVSFLSVPSHSRTQELASMLPLINLYQYVSAIKVMLATVEAFRAQWGHEEGVTTFTWWQVCQQGLHKGNDMRAGF